MTQVAHRIAATLFATLTSLSAFAQTTDWPSKPVRFVSPFPPGGSVDPLARMVAARMGETFRQQFIVENRTGASGAVGTAYAAKMPGDGYTFVFIFDTHAVNPSLQPNLQYDTLKDFAPVMLIGTSAMVLVTNLNKPYKGFADLVAAAKAKPATLSYGTVGTGSLGHLAMTLLEQATGAKFVHIPYKGGGPLTTDLLGGQIDFAIASVAQQGQYVKAGKSRALAVTGEKRSHVLPETPALAEQGYTGFSALAWWAIVTPAGIPKPVLDKFHGELTRIFNLPEVRKQLGETQGMDIVASSPEDMQKFLLAQMDRWGKVVRDNNIRME